ncbi:MAG: hypothetical protein JO301_13885 [Chitinophagaceae bacterium]|nr:hypothetical protein [Chitinophagaceae bacterium]
MKKFLLLVSCFIGCALHAQEFGGNPASVHWQQINTDTVRVIFPRGLDAKAQRVASVVHLLQRNYAGTIGNQFRKVDIVLHNQTLISNAYVQLAPYRSEFYLTPPQDPFQLGAVNWTDNLAVHEFRHVQQYSNFNKGFSKFAHVILGEQGQALANAASIPDWFFEGDAVFNETKLTRQGRGRLPLFMNRFRALYQSGRQYNFQQLRNGSLRHYVPGHYELGYLLVAYGRQKYGEDIWRKITDDAARFKPFFYPFQGAVKRNTGISFNNFVADAFRHFQSQWTRGPQQVEWLTRSHTHDVRDYLYPYLQSDGSCIVLKRSYSHPPAFVRVETNGDEKKIADRDIAIDDQFSVNAGKIIYAAYRPDPRWGYREYTRLVMLDIASGEQRTLDGKGKYFSPDISHNGREIAVVEVDEQENSKLIRLSVNGDRIDSMSKPGWFFSSPKFSADDRHIYVAVRNPAGEMAIVKYGTGEEILLPFANRPLGFLTVKGDTILYTRTSLDQDEIWAVKDVAGAPNYGLAGYPTGLYQAGLRTDGSLIASAFTADGYRLGVFTPEWTRLPGNIQPLQDHVYLEAVFPDSGYSFLSAVPRGSFPVSKYSKSSGFFNFHSYEPYFEDPEYSFTIFGENVLGTFQSELSYTYNRNEGSHKAGFNGIFGGSYVEPVFGLSQTWQRTALLSKDTAVNWNELVGYAGLQLPLNFSGDGRYRYLTLSALFNIDQVKWTGLAQKLLRDQQVNYLSSRLVYTSQAQKAVQQIYPHWAQSLVLQYRNAVNGVLAHQFLGSVAFYLPGISNTHNIVLTAAYQARDTANQYLFSNNFPFARGYSAVDFPRMWRIGFNYHLPLIYPDWGFGNIVYFLRARTNLFYDYSRGKSLRTGIETPFNTVGGELYFDTRWWNQQPVTFGIRYSRLLNNEFRGTTQPNVWEFILPVSLFR